MGVWYKEWYLTTKQGDIDMVAALSDPDPDIAAQNRSDINNRLSEMQQLDQDRCAISRDQIRFITRVLGS